MKIKQIVPAIIIAILVFAGLALLKQSQTSVPTPEATEASENLLGSDRDEHGCILSAGYSWCEAKKECLRPWETPCIAENQEKELELIKTRIKTALIAKHGQNAQGLNVSVSKIEGNYAQGGASEEGMGGGMWFAAKTNGVWQLVWDGNGIITCEDIASYPSFPTSMIPECFNTNTQDMTIR